MNLVNRYQQYIATNSYEEDALQLQAISLLQGIADALNNELNETKTWHLFKKKPQAIRGLYMWGGVGRGKTFIMDLFYEELTIPDKTRQHFNHFMQDIHRLLRAFQGQKNPLKEVAKSIAQKTKVICFDEFFVEDIADAMILGKLFRHLFELNIILIATSNIPPEKLYQGGLQRELFLPAIHALLQHLDVLKLDSGIDYRKLSISANQHYFYPLPSGSEKLRSHFKNRASCDAIYDTDIILEERLVKVKAVDENAIWFDFFSICGNARGVSDYIALAKRFARIYVSDMPTLDRKLESEARRFIAMIDEFYDEEKQVVISAAAGFNDIYQGEKLIFEFERTKSRLYEMQQQNNCTRSSAV
ncbi:cell division protein ZapE [Caedibacter taeniospiralis]|jgi:cell division protein ZapE|uniref:cell division protein ZapE n=1 Tax=Caedibacter taeniospiralis TaxID=28907 RepID=UPI0037BEA0E7